MEDVRPTIELETLLFMGRGKWVENVRWFDFYAGVKAAERCDD
jgi:hypothetical protein